MTTEPVEARRPRPSISWRGRPAGPRGYATVGTVAAMVVTGVAVLFGTGHVPSRLDLRDGGAWLLSSEKGQAVHVNGSSGQPDAGVKIGVPGSSADYEVVQDGGRVIVRNRTTGAVRSIDTTNLEAGDARDLGGRGFEVVLGDDRAYAVDRGTGVVKLLDDDLEPTGAPVRLGGELGSAVVDRDGTLWVVRIDTGEVIAIHGRTLGKAARYGRAGDLADLSVLDGKVVVVNHDQGTVGAVSEGDDVDAVSLGARGAELQVPATSTEALLVVEPGQGRVFRWTPGKPVVRVQLGDRSGHDLGAAVVSGLRAYLPDFTTGEVSVLDLATGTEIEPIAFVTPRKFDLFEKDGFVWVNDPTGADALVINAEGRVEQIEKYQADLPGLTEIGNAPTTAPQDPSPSTTEPDDDRKKDKEEEEEEELPSTTIPPRILPPALAAPPSSTPQDLSSPTPADEPPAAPVVQASAGDASADASWAVAAGGPELTGAEVTIAPAPKVGPARKVIPAGSPNTVHYDGLKNGVGYVISVVLTSDEGRSDPGRSNRVVPQDNVPTAPRVLSVTSEDRAVRVVWAPAVANGSAVVDYVVTATPVGGNPVSASAGAQAPTSAAPFELSSLRNGTSYYVTVKATTEAGTAAQSLPFGPVTPAGDPGAPFVQVRLTYKGGAGVAELTVTPTDDGGSALQFYDISGPTGSGTVLAVGSGPITFDVARAGNDFGYTAVAINLLGRRSAPSPGASLSPGSEIVVDDSDADFDLDGPTEGTKYLDEDGQDYAQHGTSDMGYGAGSQYTYNDLIGCMPPGDTGRTNTGTWSTTLPEAGRWRVDVSTIGGDGGHRYDWDGTVQPVQATGDWVTLGSVPSAAGASYVQLSDQNAESNCSVDDPSPIAVHWDAVRWTYEG